MPSEDRRATPGGPALMVCPHCGVAFPPAWPGAGCGYLAHVLEYLAAGRCYFRAGAKKGPARREGRPPSPNPCFQGGENA